VKIKAMRNLTENPSKIISKEIYNDQQTTLKPLYLSVKYKTKYTQSYTNINKKNPTFSKNVEETQETYKQKQSIFIYE